MQICPLVHGAVNPEQLFNEAKELSKAGFKDSANILLQDAMEQLILEKDSAETVHKLLSEGRECEQTGHYTLSLQLYLRAINLAESKRMVQEKGLGYLGLSNVNFRIFDNEKALANSIEASGIFKHLGDTTNYISATMLMAQVYISMEKYDTALKIYSELLPTARVTGDSILIADNLDHIGVVYGFKTQYENALNFHKEAMAINEIIGNDFHLSINYANIGEVYLKEGQYQLAIRYLHDGLSLAKKIEFRSLQIFIYYVLGEAYSLTNKDDEAINCFSMSISLIDDLGEIREKPYVLRLMSEHFERNGDTANAFMYFKKYSQANDSLNRIDAVLKTEELKALYELDQREQEYKSVLLEKKLAQQELDSSKRMIRFQYVIIILVILGLISSVVFAFYFSNSRKLLRKANSTKDLLFSILGHDLRGPIGNIKKMLDIAKTAPPEEQKTMITMLEQPANSSLELLNELLDWSSSLQNKIDFNPQLLKVHDVVEKAISIQQSQANDKNIRLSMEIDEEIKVYADSNHLYTILRNLISNAIKFTPSKGRVLIHAREIRGEITITVRDTGVGIDMASIKKILDKEQIISTYGTNREKGSGLGILLCMEFLRINQSQLFIKSTPGEGSEFLFALPTGKN